MVVDKSLRLESVRAIIDKMLLTIEDQEVGHKAFIHLYGVSQMASLLALKRGLDPELSAIIGMFHDYYIYRTGIKDFHDQSGAEAVRPIIGEMGVFTESEQGIILIAIFRHSDKATIHGAYDELIKDADVLARYTYNTAQRVKVKNAQRLKKVLNELGMVSEVLLRESLIPEADKDKSKLSRRCRLADVAQTLAMKSIIGSPDNNDFNEICSYWPDNDIYKSAKNSWCALFVYHCCRQVGIILPIKHPKGYFRFAAVGAWQDWAILIGDTYHEVNEPNFMPDKGDIVIYEQLLTSDHHDHIGIVLACEDNSIIVAEGNVDNENYAGIVKRSRVDHVAGYVRIKDNFTYSYHGTYKPRLN